MHPSQLTAARQTLQLSSDALAAQLALTPGVVRAWEAGRLAVPRRYARMVEWLVAVQERRAQLQASGLPSCPVAERLVAAEAAGEGAARVAHTRRLADHVRGCATCVERDRRIEEALPPFPRAALTPTEHAVVWLMDAMRPLPGWARPLGYLAAVVVLVLALRVVMQVTTSAVAWIGAGGTPAVAVGAALVVGVIVGTAVARRRAGSSA